LKFFRIHIFILLPIFLFSQSNLDITGRVSMGLQNIDYDEESKIKPDSISSDEYGKSTIISGLQQSVNLSLFGRMQNFDFTLLSDLKNNDWNELDFGDVNSVERFSLNLRLFSHELVLGDFYQSGNERFMRSREVRGLKYSTKIDDAIGKNTFIYLEGLGGQTQKSLEVGDRLQSIYKQFETSGQYNRFITAGNVKIGKTGLFDISLKYLQGEDNKSSIAESINPALKNGLFGAESNLFFWSKKIRLFADYFSSKKDTIDEGFVDDYSLTGGIDLLINKAKLLILYQRIGFDYYTMGYPYLENDKEGIKAIAGYNIADWLILNSAYEWYENNLNENVYKPTTKTNILNAGFTTLLIGYPEFTFNYGRRSDLGDKVMDKDSLELNTDKITQKFEAKLAYKINRSRFSLSTTLLNLDDKSLISNGISTDSSKSSPLGTDQFISSFNFYSQASQYLFFSGGIVYSTLTLTNDQKNNNYYIYESNRWDIIPRKLKLETTITAIINDAQNGGVQDYLSDYFQLNAEISFEYFFNDFVSFKIITGTDSRNFKYSTADALQIITDSDYGPTFFNGNESYSSWLVGGEFNWNF
jgi:hypothetical protein